MHGIRWSRTRPRETGRRLVLASRRRRPSVRRPSVRRPSVRCPSVRCPSVRRPRARQACARRACIGRARVRRACVDLAPVGRARVGRARWPFSGLRAGSRARLIHAPPRVRRGDSGNRMWLHVRNNRDGLGVSQARQNRGPGLEGERAVCFGSGRYQACLARTIVPVSLPHGIHAGGVRARVLSEWSRAPVIGGGWGWHAIKIQARPSFAHKRPGCVPVTSIVARARLAGAHPTCSPPSRSPSRASEMQPEASFLVSEAGGSAAAPQNVRPSRYLRTNIEKLLDI